MADTITKLNNAADAYNASPSQSEARAEAFMAVCEWLSCSYEEHGTTEAEMNEMDIETAAIDFCARRLNR